MTSDTARVFFDKNDEVEKVIAKGNVKFDKNSKVKENRVIARGKKAHFYNRTRKVHLSGRASLLRGGNLVRGNEINYELDSGFINVENPEGVMKSQENRGKR